MTLNKELPLTSLQSVLLTTGSLIFFWTYLKAYVERNGVFRWAETILENHNFILATLSLVLAAYVLDIGHNVLAATTGYVVDPYTLGYFYHLLKVYEHFDIVFGVLAGHTEVAKHTAFSHLAMPLWSYFRIIDRPYDSTDWRLQVIADCSARFLNHAIPWLIEDTNTERTLLTMVDEVRWYADVVIAGFWAFFTLQGQRENEQAIKTFGQPYKDEITARVLGAVILLYTGYAKRQEDAKKDQAKGQRQPKNDASNTTGISTATTDPRAPQRASRRQQ
ncbi:hypothetical protein H2198_000559 [Neophaeococcomyces mojaviensis]|uniref:Uncharacterized protein n=1 Tax=Neophaeococcomyces mojaviensis TaxID=3383035 RepID=A0ACC3AJT8_9EURO|nr:hypothetical protein H2198_000559 [Knufia sp. JES_112]